MQIKVIKIPIENVKDEVLAVAIFQGGMLPKEFAEFSKRMRKGEFEGKLSQSYQITAAGRFNFGKIFLFGMGEEKDFNLDYMRRFGGAAVRCAASSKSTGVSIIMPKTKNSSEAAQALVEGAILASYKCMKFKSKQEDYFEVKSMNIISDEKFEHAINCASIIANAQNYVRDMNENPGNIATPEKLATWAKDLGKEKNLAVTVLGKEELKKLGMNAILGVSQGSALPPFLVMLEYNKDAKGLPLYAVVGKGITFDSGGISIKPAKGMQEMKYDKTGAVTVLGIIKAVSELKLPLRLMAVFAATENMPSGSAQRPGDIVKAYNGKTIEVLNTDAEGRLILADALSYAAEKKPEAIIDLATLTGAIIISLGRYKAGLFSNDNTLANAIFDAGENTYERVWRMPLEKEYSEMNRGDFADIKNIGSETSDAGSITAAAFLQEFIGDCKWAHLDIAGVDMIGMPHPYLEKGASGIGVRLVVEALGRLLK